MSTALEDAASRVGGKAVREEVCKKKKTAMRKKNDYPDPLRPPFPAATPTLVRIARREAALPLEDPETVK